jgi:hypothetical protein
MSTTANGNGNATHSNNNNAAANQANSILMATLTEQLDKYNDSMYNFNPMRNQTQTVENFLEGLDSDAGISLADLDSITLLPLAGNLCSSSSNNNNNSFVESETFMGWSTQDVLTTTTTTNFIVNVNSVEMTPSPASYSSSPAFSWESSCNNDYLAVRPHLQQRLQRLTHFFKCSCSNISSNNNNSSNISSNNNNS